MIATAGPTRSSSLTRITGWMLLLALLISNGPLFLCMPIIDDTSLWDLYVRDFLRGATPYRDYFETNPPGMLWVLVLVRSLLGASSVALRAADLLFFGIVCLLLFDAVKRPGAAVPVGRALLPVKDRPTGKSACSTTGKSARPTACAHDTQRLLPWVLLVCLGFYFSISEWCHCQRDMWLLLPALTGLALRRRQVQRLQDAPTASVFPWAVGEGLCWGLGVWIKPMVVIPAFCLWAVGVGLRRRTGTLARQPLRDGQECPSYGGQTRRVKPVLVDLAGLLAGGMLAGAAGLSWLWISGAWPYFWETFLEWNPRYVAAGREHWTLVRFLGTAWRLSPWFLLNMPAVVIAVRALARAWKARGAEPAAEHREIALFAAFYLGWLAQAFCLQHLFDYVHAPGTLLAVAVCVGAVVRGCGRAGKTAALGFATVALICSPALAWNRLATWPLCVTQGSTPAVRDRLKVLQTPDWQDLHRVAEYLRRQNLRDGELACFHNSLVHLYLELGLRPATRYVFLEICTVFFADRRDVLREALSVSRQKYVVTDLLAGGLSRNDLGRLPSGGRSFSLVTPPPVGRALLPVAKPPTGKSARPTDNVYPWSQPIVFRAGRYAVHRVSRPVGSLEVQIP
jgi:hypothetical protein